MLVTLSPILWVMTLYVRGRRRSLFLFAGILAGHRNALAQPRSFFLRAFWDSLCCSPDVLFSVRPDTKTGHRLAGVLARGHTCGFRFCFSAVSSVPSTTAYLTNPSEQAKVSSEIRLFTWKVGPKWLPNTGERRGRRQFRHLILTGKSLHGSKAPFAANHEIIEDKVVERAHNEFLQIFAELESLNSILPVDPVFCIFDGQSVSAKEYRFSPYVLGGNCRHNIVFHSSLSAHFLSGRCQNG